MPISKQKVELEFEIKSSPRVLFEYLSSSSRIIEWFCDDVEISGDIYTFKWGEDVEKANLIKQKKEEFLRFQWEYDEDSKYYFEYKIVIDDITHDVSLLITDFTEEDEVEETKLYWTKTIDTLKHALGAV